MTRAFPADRAEPAGGPDGGDAHGRGDAGRQGWMASTSHMLDPGTGGVPTVVPTALADALARVRSAPAAPLVLAVAGDGGTGKTAALAALRAVLRAAGTPVVTVRGTSCARSGWTWPDVAPGTVLLVDDAHRLPEHALDRLLDLVDGDDARVVVTFRGWPRPAALAVLARELDLRSALVTLGPLDRAGVTERAAARLGRTPPAPLVDHVLRVTAGIPRLVDLLLTGTPTGGPLSLSPRPTAPLPWDLLAQLDLDLGPTGCPRREVVLALSLGAAPDAGTLSTVLGLVPDVVHDALGEARAAGLVRSDGTVVPVARQAVVGSAPAERARRVLRDSIAADLDSGASAQEVAGRVAAVRVLSPELAAVLRRAGAGLRASDPERAAQLLAAAVEVGSPDDDALLLVERAESEALAGDVEGALRLAGQVLEAGHGAPLGRAVGVATAALSHQGLLEQAAALHSWLDGQGAPPSPLAAFAALACGTPEPRTDTSGDPAAGASLDRPPTPRSEAERLLLAGLRASLTGDGTECLPLLGRASALLRGTADTRPLPETPEGLAALAALSSGDPVHAQRVLHAAIATRAGGPLALPHHRLLLAWCAMLAGRFDDARAEVVQATRGSRPLGARDELFRHALELGIARRTHDPAALVRAWPAAREALLSHGLDLLMLLPLGEIVVAAARLDQSHHVAPTLDGARELLARCGDPVLWGMPLHWSGVHAGIAAERPEALEPHAAALVRGARVSRHAAGLAEAGKVWVQVLAGRVDPAAVERAARRLHGTGLGWDGSRLAAHAAARATDGRATSHLLQVARDLQRSRPDGDAPAAPAGPAVAVTATGTGTRTGRATSVTGTSAVPSVHDEPAQAAVHLSERELEVAQLVLAGHTYREISERLYISTKTVEHHVARMRQRLGLESRAALLAHLRARLGPHP